MRADPARENCFEVVQMHKELHDYDDMSDISRRQRLHRHMHNEMQTMEIAAQNLADFPEMPWHLKMEIARQCWDEARHTQLLYRRMCELGGVKGEFPIMNYEWGVTQMLTSLPARLAVQNRTFEAGEMDLLKQQAILWNDAGDPLTASLMEVLLADEVHHVRFANRWLRGLAKESPAVLLQVAQGIQYLRKVTAALAPDKGEVNAVGVDLSAFVHDETTSNIDDRRLAEFTDEEIAELLRQEGFGPLARVSQAAQREGNLSQENL